MKNLIFLILMLNFFACKDKESISDEEQEEFTLDSFSPFLPGDQEFGSMKGFHEGEEWEGSASAIIFENSEGRRVSLRAWRESSKLDILHENLSFDYISFEPGEFSLTSNNQTEPFDSVRAFHYFNEWDITAGTYVLDAKEFSEFKVFRIDTIAKIVEGEFSATFSLETDYLIELPKKRTFEKMVFTAEIID